MSPENLLPIIILGAALVWAQHLAYGARAGKADDWLRNCLLIGGWMLILAGSGLVLALLARGLMFMVVPLFWIVVLATLHRYRESEGQALLWTLAHAAQRGVPLSHAARAFAQERTDEIGSRSWRLADALDAGLPLDAALRASKCRVPLHVLVAIRVGGAYGKLPEALIGAVTHSGEFDRSLRTILERIIYMFVAATFFCGIVTFIMLKIIPTFERMFKEFELDLPPVTKLVIALAQLFASYGFVLTIFTPLLLAALFIGLLHYVGWLPFNFPGVPWLRLGYDRTVMLRSLALAVQQQRPIEHALADIEVAFPTPAMRYRLLKALVRCRAGADCFDALCRQGLITRYEQAVLSAAERVGNLGWALEVMAETALLRLSDRVRRLGMLLAGGMFVCFSLLVLFFSAGMIAPLVNLIHNLS